MSDIREVTAKLLDFVNSSEPARSFLLDKNEAAVIVAEIEHLRGLLGAVTPGQSVADIKAHLRSISPTQSTAEGRS